ncbi:pentapeptide repeat-containing protein [Methylobacterium sp. E-005]|uniref:pentapeptide repeat-containing protein n=1 Tax=Methylobacterium sp. E-005 TaxID=2836549 RepID=UPI001FB8AFB6|nr:pentapeptide repeat-containing protein [Methylobacterium sp. E-005]MCJ2087733.1 pentapeptide repeat-containing protein [Methylobacterium sp. E-005]
MRRLALSFLLAALAAGPAAAEQDLLLGADMASPAMTKAEMSRADVEAMIKAADGKPIDLHDKALSGLDLSGLNLRGVNLRTARLNKANLRGADLSGANLEQAWFIKADLSGAKLADAKMFGITARDADFGGADLSRSMPIGDFKGANMGGATLVDLKGGADIRNQSMGLMRAVFTSVNLAGAHLKGADLGRSRLEYADLKDADLTDVVLMGSDLSGANLTGATIAGADFKNVDVSGARLIDLRGQDSAKDWAERVNADRAITRAPN